FDMMEVPAGLLTRIEYSTELFEDATIRRLAERFRTLLEAVVRDPNRRLSELPLIPVAERQLLAEWSQSSREGTQPECLHQLFEVQARSTPDATAVVGCDGQITYRELDARVNQWAHQLQALGAGAETRVAICLERSMEMIASMLAVLKAGAAY